jgi:hypothetical protein
MVDKTTILSFLSLLSIGYHNDVFGLYMTRLAFVWRYLTQHILDRMNALPSIILLLTSFIPSFLTPSLPHYFPHYFPLISSLTTAFVPFPLLRHVFTHSRTTNLKLSLQPFLWAVFHSLTPLLTHSLTHSLTS